MYLLCVNGTLVLPYLLDRYDVFGICGDEGQDRFWGGNKNESKLKRS